MREFSEVVGEDGGYWGTNSALHASTRQMYIYLSLAQTQTLTLFCQSVHVRNVI